ncbi:MAG: hypothetical protein ACOX7C_02980 [Brevefilum sp.]|jgi:hypothetical protein
MISPRNIRRGLRSCWRTLRLAALLFLLPPVLVGSAFPPGGLSSSVSSLTRPIEFDYGSWTLDAITVKFADWGLNFNHFLTPEKQSRIVLATLEQVQRVNELKAQVLIIYADPNISDPETASESARVRLEDEQTRLDALAPLAESILQAQLQDILNDVGMDWLGQVLPPSLFQTSEMPYSLVISPRDTITQTLDIPLVPGITTQTMEKLEDRIFADLDHAALVVPIGGVGTYPTMVSQTTNLVWLTETISHEWVHNFLALRPLGINYYTSDVLRTINETTASLAGKELGMLILARYYPEFLPAPSSSNQLDPAEPEQASFNYQVEMRNTRVEVDRLLTEGKVEEAETYMEARRGFFWENGYLIRKLNQAYFAFYGAYNDVAGGGAAGEDPVGPAVVAYREQFSCVGDFLKSIAWVKSFGELLERLPD